MKNLSLISFVGVDIHTNWDDILQLKSKIPCEFSVLYSDSKSLTKDPRYPNYDFCKKFLEWGFLNQIETSLHLCGTVIDRYLRKDKDVVELCDLAKRTQLNINIHSYLDHVKLTNDILFMINSHGHNLILQQNKTKEKFMKVFLDASPSQINLLHDSSGGFGREITKVSPPHPVHYTGYAGGINGSNVAKIVSLIEKNNPENKPYYIDMESGVRTNNIFSMEKCRQIVNIFN